LTALKSKMARKIDTELKQTEEAIEDLRKEWRHLNGEVWEDSIRCNLK
jgi:hypothetical protein